MNLYPRLLGPEFQSLPESLRSFHDFNGSIVARGKLNIERSPRIFARGLSRLLCLPASASTLCELQVSADKSGEIWKRTFGEQVAVSYQKYKNGFLIERAGPLTFEMAMLVRDQEIHIESRRVFVYGVKLPKLFSPRVFSVSRGLENGWWVLVTIEIPLLGMILKYSGEMTAQP